MLILLAVSAIIVSMEAFAQTWSGRQFVDQRQLFGNSLRYSIRSSSE